MTLREKCEWEIMQECSRRDSREGSNPNRYPIMLEALEFAALHQNGLAAGINQAFTSGLRNKLLRAIGVDPKSVKESAEWCREDRA